MLIVIKAVQVGWGFVYFYLDSKWLGNSLRSPEKRRYRSRLEAKEIEGDLPGFRVSKVVTCTVAAQLGALIVAAWAVSPFQILPMSASLKFSSTLPSRWAPERRRGNID